MLAAYLLFVFTLGFIETEKPLFEMSLLLVAEGKVERTWLLKLPSGIPICIWEPKQVIWASVTSTGQREKMLLSIPEKCSQNLGQNTPILSLH